MINLINKYQRNIKIKFSECVRKIFTFTHFVVKDKCCSDVADIQIVLLHRVNS